MKHIVCFHLFNDYSGSPKVLKMVLEGMLERGYEMDLVSSKGGVLDELLAYKHLHKHSYPYQFSSNPVVTMIRYCTVQLYTFLLAFRWLFKKDIVFYINTLLPVGPALAGRIMGKRVVYHYHENAFVKGAFYKVLAAAMQRLAHEIICVSNYQASFLQRKNGVTVVPNALPKAFTERLHPDAAAAFDRKTVLMLSSLKEYKGTREFMELATKLPQYKFVLVINDTQENIDNYLAQYNLQYLTNGGG
ncbi:MULTISPECIES: glycosyltransferase [Bacteroides]|uniref:glycosyltransferase n=1 Tax=Bacteroides TaxID=816 RepID=UPI001E3187A8|nr:MULTISPECIES: glycosyltransferase [Bacteroides]MDC1767442.1 glycosyltransferase [Bacteroides uniformis]MDC1771066.1 glycosyltransferase [Bacteroides uniformis]MDC1777304.1 glycosyltransferase [Bacteroides uniformis]MDC1778798.1 glycosyltransferase [Bacteroides uniformis]